ncbi:tRNA (adenine(58)-N(1))-methyltransferase, mitochondrial isoform X2 [Rhinoraja longicauda]
MRPCIVQSKAAEVLKRGWPGLIMGLVRAASRGVDADGDGDGNADADADGDGDGGQRDKVWSMWPGRDGPPVQRPLSPLERVSSLIPHQMLPREVLGWSLQEEEQMVGDDIPRHGQQVLQSMPLQHGDLVLAEFRRRHRLELQKMFLLAPGGEMHSRWGMLSHQEVLGHLPGQVFRTSTGADMVLRRPTLEEFVLLMRRGPAISYPKDATTMLMMMDVGDGDSVLESGSGSGAMTLFLSRAVGPSGHVYSFEVRKDHHGRAKRNYQCWRNAYEVARQKEWLDNVDFINKDVALATEDIQGKMFDAISLDMLSPQLALPVIHAHLKQGGVCAVYLANITQVIDLLEGVRRVGLPLSCEKILEVVHRNWFVAPACRKDGNTAPRVEPQTNVDDLEHGEESDAAQDYGWRSGRVADSLCQRSGFNPNFGCCQYGVCTFSL